MIGCVDVTQVTDQAPAGRPTFSESQIASAGKRPNRAACLASIRTGDRVESAAGICTTWGAATWQPSFVSHPDQVTPAGSVTNSRPNGT